MRTHQNTYRIVDLVSRYISYCEVVGNTQPYPSLMSTKTYIKLALSIISVSHERIFSISVIHSYSAKSCKQTSINVFLSLFSPSVSHIKIISAPTTTNTNIPIRTYSPGPALTVSAPLPHSSLKAIK